MEINTFKKFSKKNEDSKQTHFKNSVKRNKFFSCFTLSEFIVVLIIAGIFTVAVLPKFTSSWRRAEDDNAHARGAVLDLAKSAFLQQGGASAQIAWNNADQLPDYSCDENHTPTGISPRDEVKYDLLRPYLGSCSEDLGCGTETGQYTSKGYWYSLNGLEKTTTVSRRHDSEITSEKSKFKIADL